MILTSLVCRKPSKTLHFTSDKNHGTFFPLSFARRRGEKRNETKFERPNCTYQLELSLEMKEIVRITVLSTQPVNLLYWLRRQQFFSCIKIILRDFFAEPIQHFCMALLFVLSIWCLPICTCIVNAYLTTMETNEFGLENPFSPCQPAFNDNRKQTIWSFLASP